MDAAATNTNIEQAASNGLGSLMNITPLVTVLVLIVMGLCWFIKGLLQDARDERKLTRDALVNNTSVIAELKEMIRIAIAK